MISVGDKQYKESIFLLQAQVAYAKAIAFHAEARVTLGSRSIIWGAVAGYYSLFHLTIALMYILPELVEADLLAKLVKGREDGASDPTGRIQHSSLPRFLATCENRGLTADLRLLLLEFKALREFANYQPRVIWKGDSPTFLTCQHSSQEVRHAVARSEVLLRGAIRWAYDELNSENWRAIVPVISLEDFFTRDDLFFVQWCRPEAIEEAKRLSRALPFIRRAEKTGEG